MWGYSGTGRRRLWPFILMSVGLLPSAAVTPWPTAAQERTARDTAGGPSAEAERIRQALQASVKAAAPTHRLWLANDRSVSGILVSESDTTLVLRQVLGPRNEMTVPYRKSEVVRVEALPAVTVTSADVRLQMDFPSLTFFKRPPYSVVTDESYFLVRNAMDALEKLHQQFHPHFPEGAAAPGLPIQIVFFGRQDDFRRYAKGHAPHLEMASGFYSSEHNRLVLFNQTASEDMASFRQRVAELRRQWVEAYPQGLPPMLSTQLRNLEQRGLEYTYMVIRHEGAHQLLRSYGVLTQKPPVPWLEEGLAAYCETSRIGQVNTQRLYELKTVRSEGQLLSWRALVEYRSAGGLLGRDPTWSRSAYAQSWLMAYALMRDHPDAFHRYVRSADRGEAGGGARPESPADQLARAVGLTWPQVEALLDGWLARLLAY